MFAWLNGPGRVFKEPLPGSTNYLSAYDKSGRLIRARKDDPQSSEGQGKLDKGAEPDESLLEDDAQDEMLERRSEGMQSAKAREDRGLPPESLADLRPFPLNKDFRSQPVLSEELRNEIYTRVAVQKMPVRLVSAELGIAMDRVGAVVRLKRLEEDWIKQGKQLARPYAKAVLAMLPQTPLAKQDPNSAFPPKQKPHESINDLPVHQATRQQIFHPTSESRAFTRADAGKVFDPTGPLLPADERIPHPELVLLERDMRAGVPREERVRAQLERMRAEAERREGQERRRAEEERRAVRTVKGRRWDFKFRDVSVEDVGEDGRSPRGVGWRYGFPHEDRKRGQVKIPRRVE